VRFPSRYAHVVSLFLLFALSTCVSAAERPPSPRLLPKETLLLFRVADARDFVERFQKTAVGRMSQDEQLKPVAEEFTASVFRLFSQMEESTGINLRDLLTAFQGEVTIAAVARSQAKPGFMLIGDLGEDPRIAERLLGKVTDLLTERGATRKQQRVAGVSLTVLEVPNNSRDLMHFQKDQTLVVASSQDLVEEVLARWDGGGGESLADNDKFVTIMNRCRTDKEDAPQVRFFFDPIGMAQGSAYGNSRMQLTLALLPTVGLDGLKGLGGSVTIASGKFEQITHFHVLLDNPRAGAIRLIALKPGETKPEPWVPAGVCDYVTFHWDLEQSYESLSMLMDSFQSEGSFEKQVQRRVGRYFDVDPRTELIGALSGRITYAGWYERPARVDGRAALWAFQLKDPDRFERTLGKIVDGKRFQYAPRGFGRKTYYQRLPRQFAGGEQEKVAGPREEPDSLPCLAIVDDYLVYTDRPRFMQKVLATHEGDGDTERLADSIEYKLIASKTRRLVRGTKPAMMMFNRPEETLRHMYEIGASDEALQDLGKTAERYDILKPLHDSFSKTELPPYSVLQQYVAPGGGIIIDDETGVHFTSFTLMRE